MQIAEGLVDIVRRIIKIGVLRRCRVNHTDCACFAAKASTNRPGRSLADRDQRPPRRAHRCAVRVAGRRRQLRTYSSGEGSGTNIEYVIQDAVDRVAELSERPVSEMLRKRASKKPYLRGAGSQLYRPGRRITRHTLQEGLRGRRTTQRRLCRGSAHDLGPEDAPAF